MGEGETVKGFLFSVNAVSRETVWIYIFFQTNGHEQNISQSEILTVNTARVAFSMKDISATRHGKPIKILTLPSVTVETRY